MHKPEAERDREQTNGHNNRIKLSRKYKSIYHYQNIHLGSSLREEIEEAT